MAKYCAVCQNKIGFFSPWLNLTDGYLCNNCAKKVGLGGLNKIDDQATALVSSKDIKDWINENIIVDPQKVISVVTEEKEEDIKYLQNCDLTELAHATDKAVLRKNEYVFYEVNGGVQWYEDRVHRTGSHYSGMGMSFKVAKGVYIHSGRGHSSGRSYTEKEVVHEGDIILTNKRILLVSPNDSAQITLSSIVNVQPYSDGIVIQKNRGKDVTLKEFDGTKIAIVITRLISGDTQAHQDYSNTNTVSNTDQLTPQELFEQIKGEQPMRLDEDQKTFDLEISFPSSYKLKQELKDDHNRTLNTIKEMQNNLSESSKSICHSLNDAEYILRIYSDNFQTLIFEYLNGKIKYSILDEPDIKKLI